MAKFNIEKAILRHIVIAQIASDIAKDKNMPEYQKIQGYNDIKILNKYMAYSLKDKSIAIALKLIDSTPKCGVNYYVIREEDQNTHLSNIIYFNFKINGKRYQISFHNFTKNIKINYAIPAKGRQCHWEGGLGGSREATLKLIDQYFS